MVMEGIGWKPSSLAGREGLEVQKYTWGKGNHFSHFPFAIEIFSILLKCVCTGMSKKQNAQQKREALNQLYY